MNWTFLRMVPNEQEYMEMLACKTGCCMMSNSYLMHRMKLIESNGEKFDLKPEKLEAIHRVMLLFGSYSQLRNDLMNFQPPKVCHTIREST